MPLRVVFLELGSPYTYNRANDCISVVKLVNSSECSLIIATFKSWSSVGSFEYVMYGKLGKNAIES
jgi:hypothetical protein